ncbi:hypothetical protein D6C86_09990 [Aureobasidium pullulans]|uniref:Uncharacterized protein n=1 Tax=Aureobasidium pullulans TaxID=5580 RepID=A0A4S9PHG0_AURPU|nr:hypothetical protein D6D20_05770 [Aureobasidium pullulans]THY69252.1 hypothetical protein D6C94_09720 [Aureobasidium pullulans]THZ38475.1 hypothetical protein D6C87_07790 [Aureobasidium pullulans]THZ53094.1 hypothetical protein D6C86_09990 [Aureobasidium pullulans]THZ97613.1 hypothetical protein D6C88_01174 [Aureobasidium pullulans]
MIPTSSSLLTTNHFSSFVTQQQLPQLRHRVNVLAPGFLTLLLVSLRSRSERTAPSSFVNTKTTLTIAPISPTPDNNPALARYIAKRQAKAGATVPSSLPSNHTNRPSNRTTQIVNPKSRSRTPSKATNLEPGSFSHHSLPVTTASTSLRSILHAIVCSRAWIDRTISHRLLPAPTSTITCKKLYKVSREHNLTRYHYLAWTNNLFKIPRPYVKANYVKALMRKDRTHTSHSMDLPMELRYMIPHLALQFDTENPCRPAD